MFESSSARPLNLCGNWAVTSSSRFDVQQLAGQFAVPAGGRFRGSQRAAKAAVASQPGRPAARPPPAIRRQALRRRCGLRVRPWAASMAVAKHAQRRRLRHFVPGQSKTAAKAWLPCVRRFELAAHLGEGLIARGHGQGRLRRRPRRNWVAPPPPRRSSRSSRSHQCATSRGDRFPAAKV